MDDIYFKLVNYSEKAVALLIERDGVLTDELYAIGGKYNYRLSCGPGWIFPRKKSLDALIRMFEDYEIRYKFYELDELPTVNEPGKGNNPEPSADWIMTDDERREWAKNVMGDEEYYYKRYNVVVKLSGGEIVPISKPELKTEFWHHDEGPNYEEHCRITKTEQSMRNHFIGENTDGFRELIEDFTNPGSGKQYYNQLWLGNWYGKERNQWNFKWLNISPESTNCREALGWHDPQLQSMYDKGYFKPLSDDDRKRLLSGYRIALDAMERRCNSWLKRYGTGKLSFRTYWADR